MKEGHESSLLSVSSGVPQGSYLRPSLFLVYFNDIGRYFKFSKIRLFADDAPVNSHSDVHRIQKHLDVSEKWAQQWKMVFNVEKC